MLFSLMYTPRRSPEAADGSPRLFVDWQPAIGFRDHWSFARGGGVGLIEVESSAALTGAMAPFTPFFDFQVEQVVVGEEGAATSVQPSGSSGGPEARRYSPASRPPLALVV